MKIVSIVGARPQFIKCAPVSRELRKEHEEVLVHTGQHYDHSMSEVFFEELAIPKPDYNLNIGSGTHGHQTGAMLGAIENVLEKESPDVVLVYGDTNSTLAGALAAAKLHVPVAHVEAGLRSFDRRMPEEVNRVLTDHCSDMLFCPTETAVRNLAAEGVTEGVFLVGDVMCDAMEYNRAVAEERSRVLEEVGVRPGEYLVLTVHRPSNTDSRENMAAILGALGEAGRPAVFPVHPRTRKYLSEYGLLVEMPENIRVIEPLGYLDMLHLMAQRPLHHPPGEHRVGRNGGGRVERACGSGEGEDCRCHSLFIAHIATEWYIRRWRSQPPDPENSHRASKRPVRMRGLRHAPAGDPVSHEQPFFFCRRRPAHAPEDVPGQGG
ncbi:MAG: UDP-N-acetylglucosamine 2-epimerase, partial [Methanoculleus marisnigri]